MRFDARLLSRERHPRGLASLSDPPDSLFATAELPEGLAVAIVGTRAADPEHLRFAANLAADLAGAGIVVVSGGAIGIDAAAHRGALDAQGKTVAVLATGFRRTYPPEHDALFARIAAEGVLVCEHAHVAPHPGRFLERNRLVAAMSDAVVVVQAPLRSGALSTATLARRLGRLVFAVPSVPWDARSAGSTALLTQPGTLACTHASDVIRVLDATIPMPGNPTPPARPRRTRRGPPETPRQLHPDVRAEPATEPSADPGSVPRTAQSTTQRKPRALPPSARPTVEFAVEPTILTGLDDEPARVLACLGITPVHRDELVARTGLDVARLQHALLQLLLSGTVSELADGRVARAAGR